MIERLYKKYRYSLILLKELVITDFKLRYQGSALGYLWSLLRPLFLFIILYFVFVYFLRIGQGIPHWPVAMLFGIVMWNFFAEVTNGGLKAIVNRGGLIRKMNFPKYIIIISGTISALINLSLNMIIVGIFLVINGVEPSWSMLVAPLFILQIFVLGLGMAFLLSAIYVRLRDVQYIWEIIMQGLFYASAIIFPITRVVEMSPTIANILLLNPVAQAVQDARHFLVSGDLQTLFSLTGNIWLAAAPIIATAVIFILGAWYFHEKSPHFAEEA